MTIEAAKRGYAFATVHPRGDRDFQAKTINVAFVVDEGSRAYIERINIIGNTRTRDYVIRREFDIGEGDAYNRALIDRAERRLKNLDYFKTVKITNEPGSAPDRVVVNVNVEEKPTGEFSVSGGYSTAQGFLSDISIADRNLMGRGQFAKASVSYGQYSKGATLSFVEPYLLGYRMAGGIDLFAQQTLASTFTSYGTQSIGTNLRLGFRSPKSCRCSRIIRSTSRRLRCRQFNNCISTTTPSVRCTAARIRVRSPQPGTVDTVDECYSDGEASLPVRKELSGGPVMVSLAGYSLVYNALDNNASPTNGFYGKLTQDVAGLGGDVNFVRTSIDTRNYYELVPDVVGLLHLQAGHIPAGAAKICACWIISRWARTWCAALRRLVSVRAI